MLYAYMYRGRGLRRNISVYRVGLDADRGSRPSETRYRAGPDGGRGLSMWFIMYGMSYFRELTKLCAYSF